MSSSLSTSNTIIASSSASTSTDITASSIHCLVCFDTLVNYFHNNPSSPSSSSSASTTVSSLLSTLFSSTTTLSPKGTKTETNSDKPSSSSPLSPSGVSTSVPSLTDNITKQYSSLFDNSCPLFITLKKRDKNNQYTILRGCIGSLTPRLLKDNIPKYTLKSALEDKRFSPLTSNELPLLQISLSLLINYEKIKQWNDWLIGIHGIIIEFTIDKQFYTATYLPEVAKDQDWDHTETITSLIRKSGYSKKLSPENWSTLIRVTRYQSSKIKLTYDEYCTMKKNYV